LRRAVVLPIEQIVDLREELHARKKPKPRTEIHDRIAGRSSGSEIGGPNGLVNIVFVPARERTRQREHSNIDAELRGRLDLREEFADVPRDERDSISRHDLNHSAAIAAVALSVDDFGALVGRT
jgi:hypothetical protein